jgi:2-oxoglutarate ferredoxin oxidoreductase subunit beta
MKTVIDNYIREEMFPNIWCPGCGNGIVLGAILRAIDDLNWDKNKIVAVSGIGCSSRITGYVDFYTMNTTHGRALPFATGIKMANPDLKVIVVMGDGDCSAIGGNHFIHAARRNIDLTNIRPLLLPTNLVLLHLMEILINPLIWLNWLLQQGQVMWLEEQFIMLDNRAL